MRKDTEKPSFFVRLATVIVDKRKLIFFLYACALLFCLFSRNWVSVCNDITEYLPDSTETRQGLTLMEEEFTTFGTARVMVSHVTRGIAEDLAEQIGEIEGVSSASLGDSIGAEEDGEAETPEDIASYFKGADALISVTFAGEEDDESALAAMEAIRELLAPYDFYIDSSVGDSQADSLADEMGIILAVAAVIIVLVLLLTSRSYAEIPVLLITFIVAALLNLGTNFIFGEISFVSNSVTVVLQLALAIDYAIIMLHRFLEEREHAGDREACIAAVSAAIPSISASSLTTISGLAAMMFMQFRIGYDMGIILAKSIIFSMVAVFFLMPGLLLSCCKTRIVLFQGDGEDPPPQLHPQDRPLGRICPEAAPCGSAAVHCGPGGGLFPLQPVPLCVRLYPDRDCAAERVPGGGAAGQRHLRHPERDRSAGAPGRL